MSQDQRFKFYATAVGIGLSVGITIAAVAFHSTGWAIFGYLTFAFFLSSIMYYRD